jgi:DNA-directed RNA polymerase subunit E'/Rpb7
MVKISDVYYRELLRDKVKLPPHKINKNVRQYLLEELSKSKEGFCTRHGYIKTGSIEIYRVSMGTVDIAGLNGHVVYDIEYYADVCNPLNGNILRANVVNVNKFGILAEVRDNDDHVLLEIIIPKTSVNIIQDEDIDLDIIKPGDTVNVEIIGKKYELNDTKIGIIGKIVKTTAKKSTGVIGIGYNDEEDNGDEEDNEDNDDNDDNEDNGDEGDEGDEGVEGDEGDEGAEDDEDDEGDEGDEEDDEDDEDEEGNDGEEKEEEDDIDKDVDGFFDEDDEEDVDDYEDFDEDDDVGGGDEDDDLDDGEDM